MFASIIAAVSSTLADNTLRTFVTLDVLGVEYTVVNDVRPGSETPFVSVKAGVNQSETRRSTIWISKLILDRELRRRGVENRGAKVYAVKALHHLIADAIKDATNAHHHDLAASEGQNDPPLDDDGLAAYYDEVGAKYHFA